ncbi:MAG: heavy-metal-associated domain-containing protein [Planctomycetes bacterium]|nr:heavy-metal-associated domain-containing protein [Planctomycetota bacterium]
MKGVTDALERLDGAAHVTVDLQQGLATVTPRPGARFTAEQVRDALRHAGYRGEGVEVEATGKGTVEGGRWVFRLPGQDAPWLSAAAGPEGDLRIRARIAADGSVTLRE